MRTEKQRAGAGFTIVELLIVIVVIAILAAVSIVSYVGIQERAKSVAILAAVDQWSKTIAMEAAMGSKIASHTCLGSADDFPARDGFEAGVCVIQDGAAVMTYAEEAYDSWSPTPRPEGGLVPTRLKADGIELEARGIWVHSVNSTRITLAWVPQLSGQCGKGSVTIENPNPTAGGYCMLAVTY